MKLLIRLDITVQRTFMADIADITVQGGVIAKAVNKWEDFSEEEQAIYRKMNIEMESRLYDEDGLSEVGRRIVKGRMGGSELLIYAVKEPLGGTDDVSGLFFGRNCRGPHSDVATVTTVSR
jgi:hypothetical protein